MVDQLMRVSQREFNAMKKDVGPKPLIGAMHVAELDAAQIMSIHRNSVHPGV